MGFDHFVWSAVAGSCEYRNVPDEHTDMYYTAGTVKHIINIKHGRLCNQVDNMTRHQIDPKTILFDTDQWGLIILYGVQLQAAAVINDINGFYFYSYNKHLIALYK